MANRLFLSMSEDEFAAFEAARENLGMNRSKYVRYLMMGQKDLRPPSLRYSALIDRIGEMERDLKVIAMKECLSESDRLYVMESIKEIKKIVNKHYSSGQIVQNL